MYAKALKCLYFIMLATIFVGSSKAVEIYRNMESRLKWWQETLYVK